MRFEMYLIVYLMKNTPQQPKPSRGEKKSLYFYFFIISTLA